MVKGQLDLHKQRLFVWDKPHKSTYFSFFFLAIGMNLYRGSNLWKRSAGRAVFGGQIVGQAITAAQKSVDDLNFLVHSLHCYFVNPTKTNPDVIYEVEQLKNGRSFYTRSVKAWQEGRVVLHALTSFYKVDTPATNLSHTSSVMPAAPRPPDDDHVELDKRFISFTDSAGIKCAHMYLYMSEEQLKSCETKSPTHPRYKCLLLIMWPIANYMN